MMKKLILLGLSLCCFSTIAQKKWTLKECIDYAIENNISVKQSELDLETAEIDKRGAVGNFLPNLNASVSYNWINGLNPDLNTGTNVIARTQGSSPSISSGITLYDGLRNIKQLQAAKLKILASQYQLEDMKDNISLNIINAYLQVAFSKESLKTVKRQYELNQIELDRSEQLVEAGIIPKGDLLELESTLANQEQQIINTVNSVRISKINLANILAIVDYKSFTITNSIEITSTSILEKTPFEIYRKALGTRNDIKNAEITIDINENSLQQSKGLFHPTLTGNYSYGSNYYYNLDPILEPGDPIPETPSYFEQLKNKRSHRFGLSLNIPIFNRFETSNAVRRAKINLEKSKLALEQTKTNLKSKVNQSYNDVLSAYAVYEASQKTLEARKEAFRYSQEKFDLGIMNSFDYTLAKTRFENAENDVIKSKYDYFFKAKVLEFYFGLPLE